MPTKDRGKHYYSPGGVVVGSGGQLLKEILAGSVGGCYPAISASSTEAASFSVSGMSASHKVMASVYSGNDSCSLTLTRVVPSGDVITASLGNVTETDISSEGSTVLFYIAIKEHS